MENIINNIVKATKSIISSLPEKEVERLLKSILHGTEFANKVYAVGGYLRDELLGIESKDLDIVVEMKNGAEKITKWIFHTFGSHIITTPLQMGRYPIWQITFKSNIKLHENEFHTKGAVVEFADTMKESFPDENSRQREIEYGTLREDVDRRDFSVNSLLKDLTTGEFKDLTGQSIEDIKKGVLRGNPGVDFDKILKDDPLRILRLIRAQCKYGWKIPMSVLRIAKANAERIKIISAERILGELEKVMKLGKLHQAIRLMDLIGVLPYVLPEVSKLKGVAQSPDHHSEGDAYVHTMLVLKNAKPTIEAQISALLHDIGKPDTQEVKENRITFYNHENVGATIAETILRRMKFDSDTIKKVTNIVKYHMRPYNLKEEKTIRKFLRDLGDELADAVLDVSEADEKSSIPLGGKPSEHIPDLKRRIEEIRKSLNKPSNKPILNGNEIADILKIKPSEKFKVIMEFLKDLADDKAIQGKELTKEDATKAIIEKFK